MARPFWYPNRSLESAQLVRIVAETDTMIQPANISFFFSKTILPFLEILPFHDLPSQGNGPVEIPQFVFKTARHPSKSSMGRSRLSSRTE